jgi:GDPmannose 4,6-dehydratase
MVVNLFSHYPKLKLFKVSRIAIIFGANGQDGYYLNALLSSIGLNVIRISRTSGDLIGSIGDFNFVSNIIKKYLPEYVFHFAANSSTHHSTLFENNESISNGTLNLLEAIKLYSKETKVFISGSAMQFQNDNEVISINTPFEHSSLYSVARIHSVYTARYYRDVFDLKVYIGYLFNHDSSFRSERHINQKIAQTAIRIKNGSKELLEIGDLDVQKEFNYAGDIVNAIWVFINQNNIYEIIIASGKLNSISDWVEICFAQCGLDWNKYVRPFNGFISPYKKLYGDASQIKSIGWTPKLDIEGLATIMLNKL